MLYQILNPNFSTNRLVLPKSKAGGSNFWVFLDLSAGQHTRTQNLIKHNRLKIKQLQPQILSILLLFQWVIY